MEFSIKKIKIYSTYLFAISIATGGIWTMIKSQISLPWVIEAIVAYLIVKYLYVFILGDMSRTKKSFYKVEFSINHKKMSVSAFLDTGNFLYEPISHLPVCILQEKTFLRYFQHSLSEMIEEYKLNDIRMIPYKSIGMEHGVMPGIIVNDIKIIKEDQIIKSGKTVIAITKNSF